MKRKKTENCLKLRWMDRLDVRLSDKRSMSQNASIKLLNVSLAMCPSTRRSGLLYLHLCLPKSPKPRSTQSHKIQPEVPQNPSTTMDKKLPVNIRTALSRNIPALSHIHVAAFEKDKCWQSMQRSQLLGRNQRYARRPCPEYNLQDKGSDASTRAERAHCRLDVLQSRRRPGSLCNA